MFPLFTRFLFSIQSPWRHPTCLFNANYYILQGKEGCNFYLMNNKRGTRHNGVQQLDYTNDSNNHSIIQNVWLICVFASKTHQSRNSWIIEGVAKLTGWFGLFDTWPVRLSCRKMKRPRPEISTQRWSLDNLPVIERLVMAPVDVLVVIIVFKSTQEHCGGSS